MTMEQRFSPNEHLAKLVQSWNGTTFLIGAAIFPLLAFMDIFLLPGHYQQFILYRVAISIILIALYYLNRLKRSIPYQYMIGAVATALSAITIEIAVMQSGGQNSPYYAAMLILTICALGLVPISMGFAVTLVGIIYAVYLVPIILSEPVLSGVFISNNAFLSAMFMIALILRYHNGKLLLSEIMLRDELSREKAKLEVYSTRLQELVADKTRELTESEQKYRGLFENAMDGIAVLDRNGILLHVNSRFCEIHGSPPGSLLGTPFGRLEKGEEVALFDARLGEILLGRAQVYEAAHIRGDGRVVSLEISAKEIMIGGSPHVQMFVRDITEKRKLQEHVIRSQKLDSLGLLAGGIAHDFKNIITAVLTHAAVLRRLLPVDEAVQRGVKMIEDAARRASQMVSNLLSFSRKETLEKAPTDLNRVVRDTVQLLEHTCQDRAVSVRVRTKEGLPAFPGDRIHIEQAITNLVLNALDAMPGGGELTITTGLLDACKRDVTGLLLPGPGTYVTLKITDTGTGISRNIVDRIYDPFFTTKEDGKGTGLGLAMVYGIVKGHNGEIQVDSSEGKGTTFSLYFPAAQHASPVPPLPSAAE